MAARTTSDAQDGAEPYSLTVEAATAYSGMSRTRIEALLAAGAVEAKRAGRRTLILASSLRTYIDSLPSAR